MIETHTYRRFLVLRGMHITDPEWIPNTHTVVTTTPSLTLGGYGTPGAGLFVVKLPSLAGFASHR